MSWRSSSLLVTLSALWASGVHGDDFSARYDPGTDEIVVNLIYRGTNPNHTFVLKWGECQTVDQSGGNQQIVVEVLDNQWDDAALNGYTRTVRFRLDGLACRPAQVTLRTAPHFYATLIIPAAPASAP